MPLDQQQITSLQAAIDGYAFPTVYFDFTNQREIIVASIRELEPVFLQMLLSEDPIYVKHGLANVIYWGNANAGYQIHRTNQFMDNVEHEGLERFQAMVMDGAVPTLSQIKDLKLPQYSGISFISKVLAFLDPSNYCVLDLLLSRMGSEQNDLAISRLNVTTQIGVTQRNSNAYTAWCGECSRISSYYYGGHYRVVDVERGFFHLIQTDRLDLAIAIYESA